MSLGLFWPNHWLVTLSSLGPFHAVLITEASKYILVSTEQIFLLLKYLVFTKSVIRMENKFTWLKQPKKDFKSTWSKENSSLQRAPTSENCPELPLPASVHAASPSCASPPSLGRRPPSIMGQYNPDSPELGVRAAPPELQIRGFPGGSVRIHLPMQGAQVPALIREGPACHTSNYTPASRPRTCAPEPGRLQEAPPQKEARVPRLESSPAHPAAESPPAAVRT